MIRNASVFQEDGTFRQEDVCIREGRFEEAGTSGSDSVIVDAKGLMAIPGLVDIHFHGCMGYDFCDGTEEAIRQIAEYELREGITSIVPATMTFPEEKLGIIMESAAAFSQRAFYLDGEERRTESGLYRAAGCGYVPKTAEESGRFDPVL